MGSSSSQVTDPQGMVLSIRNGNRGHLYQDNREEASDMEAVPRASDVMGAGGEFTPPLHSESIVPKSTLNIRLTPTERYSLHSLARNISRQQTEANTENHNQ